MHDLLDVAFARFGGTRSVVTAASVVVAIGAASVGVVAIARFVIVAIVVARLVVTGLRRIIRCAVIVGLVVITAICRSVAVASDVVDLVSIGCFEFEIFFDDALAAIGTSSRAEHFLSAATFAWTWCVEHNVAGARFLFIAATPLAHAAVVVT